MNVEESSICEFWRGPITFPYVDPVAAFNGFPKIKVLGHLTTRTVVAQNPLPHMLAEQNVSPDCRYSHEIYLPMDATSSREDLYQRLLAQPPVRNRVFGRQALLQPAGDLGWDIVAAGLSDYAEDSGVFDESGRAFNIVGYHSFGSEEVITRDPNMYMSEPINPEVLNVNRCETCFDDHLEDPAMSLMFPCYHKYHKSCLLRWLFTGTMRAFHDHENLNYKARCPTCNMAAS